MNRAILSYASKLTLKVSETWQRSPQRWIVWGLVFIGAITTLTVAGAQPALATNEGHSASVGGNSITEQYTDDETTGAMQNLTAPPVNRTSRLVVSTEGGNAGIRFWTNYPARTAAEAQRAKNDNLSPEWFDGQTVIETVFQRVSDSEDDLSVGRITSTYRDPSFSYDPSPPEYGEISLLQSASWTDYFGPNETMVVDERYTDVLSPGDELRVEVPRQWEPERVRGQWGGGGSKRTDYYEWTIENGSTSPLLVFNGSVSRPTDENGAIFSISPLGVFGIVVLIGLFIRLIRRVAPLR